MRHVQALTMLLTALTMTGCSAVAPFPPLQKLTGSAPADDVVRPVAQRPPMPPPRPQPVYQVALAPAVLPPAAIDDRYTLDSGDKLRVVVYGQEGLTNSYSVDVAGNITMPLIGPVSARGLTTSQLGQAISAKLRQGYIREPHVAVEVDTYRPFFILGEVTFPGQYPYVANMTVETAVAIAGGFTPRARRDEVNIARPYGPQIVRGTVPVFTVVRPGDTISIAERWF
ncbi:MAG TPA: polysaccharide biosynthesis/export family protein [Xanthobacteraceae bacterium]|nr:polysaccharide biosynthesis/export family protein [Xanthobacteraceae bacterium]